MDAAGDAAELCVAFVITELGVDGLAWTTWFVVESVAVWDAAGLALAWLGDPN